MNAALGLYLWLFIWPFHHHHKTAPPSSSSIASEIPTSGITWNPSTGEWIVTDPDHFAPREGCFENEEKVWFYWNPEDIVGFVGVGESCNKAWKDWRGYQISSFRYQNASYEATY